MYKIVSLIFCLALICIGCDSTGANPDDENESQRVLAGEYRTTTFIVFPEEVQRTLYIHDGGGFIRMTLNEDSTVRGRMYIPEEFLEGESDQEGDFDISFEGTYSTRGDTVFFNHEADTFIRDVVWIWSDNTIRTLAWSEGAVILAKDEE